MAVHQLLLRNPLRLTLTTAMVALITMRVGRGASLPAVPAAAVIDLRGAAEQIIATQARLRTVTPPVIVLLAAAVQVGAGEVHGRHALRPHLIVIDALVIVPGLSSLARLVIRFINTRRHGFNVEAGTNHLLLLHQVILPDELQGLPLHLRCELV